MAFFEAIRLALQTIRAQKLKSAFSIIGVFIGVMFLIAVVSVVQGMNRYMTDKFAGTMLGVNTFRLRQFPDVQLGNVTDSTWRVWRRRPRGDRKSTRLNSRHRHIHHAVLCLEKKKAADSKRA